MAYRGRDGTMDGEGASPATGHVRATLREAAHAARPRAAFVAELEAHLRRQPPPPPAPPPRWWGGVRALVLVAILALGLGALALVAGRGHPAAPLATTARGEPTPTIAAGVPTPTAVVGGQSRPTGASTALSLGAVVGMSSWVPGWIADPTVAYLLIVLGALAVLLEVFHPGALVPGMVGGVALLLGAIGLIALPFNWAGLLLLIVALALVVADVHMATHGALTLAALIAFVPGSLLLFAPAGSRPPGQAAEAVALPAVLALAALLGAFGLGVGAAVASVRARPPYRFALPEAGMVGLAVGPLAPAGVIRVGGQLWSARADQDAPIATDQAVRILAREGLTLVVVPVASGAAGEREFPDVDY